MRWIYAKAMEIKKMISENEQFNGADELEWLENKIDEIQKESGIEVIDKSVKVEYKKMLLKVLRIYERYGLVMKSKRERNMYIQIRKEIHIIKSNQ